MVAVLLLGWSAGQAAEALRGAGAILDAVAAQAHQPEVAKPMSEAAKLRLELTNFTARASSLAPALAAQEWLALVDRLLASPVLGRLSSDEENSMPLQVEELFSALPPPAAWPELSRAIAARPGPASLKEAREFGLHLLGQALAGDLGALTRTSAEFEALLLKASREESMQLLRVYRDLDTALLGMSDDPKAILAGVERELLAAERGREYGYSSIRLPDLVELIGEEQAAPLVRRAVVSKAQNLSIEGKGTTELARRIALAAVAELKAPRWSLCDSLDCIELYEAMEKRFSVTKAAQPANAADALADLESRSDGNAYEKQGAATYYLMALIVHGRGADAARLARQPAQGGGNSRLETSAVLALGSAGYTEALDNFLHELLSQAPELSYWEAYFAAAAKTGKTERMLKLAQEAAAKPGLAPGQSGPIRENLSRALLVADRVEEGVAELRALLASAPKAGGQPSRSSSRGTDRPIDWQTHALTLARLGQLLEKPAWTAEGLAFFAREINAEAAEAEGDYQVTYHERQRVEALIQAGRLADAEKVMADRLGNVVRKAARQPAYNGYAAPRGATAEPLTALVAIYHRAGRPEDVLLLLERSPYWGVKDLAAFLTSSTSEAEFDFEGMGGGHSATGSKGSRLGHAAAAALAKLGRKEEARAVVNAMLNRSAGDDRAYEVLLQLEGQKALPRLDELFARDQFEERPLIWKALLLHQAGREEEAEQVARQAISIDPSDGEQGKGDRMRVYAVLADIRAARGNAKDAEFFRGVVRAIRLSERADDFMAVGLMTRAVKMYQESLNHFKDAYCIQSRLAVQLSELGQHELAAQHYEKAFELMPDSFGRVESHCFGCESTFATPRAQGVAERVFTALVARNPNKPQIHYLLGYLREQQGRGRDSLPHFQRAVELDPDYLNAWKHLEDENRGRRLPSADRDKVALNILRLDPLGRHARATLANVTDLRKLWMAVEAAAKFQVQPPVSLLALTASSAALEKQESEARGQRSLFQGSYNRYSRYFEERAGPGSPGRVLAQHSLLVAIAGLMNSTTRGPF